MSAQFKLCDYQRQAIHAEKIGWAWVQYALEIGCVVHEDEVIAPTMEQCRLLTEKWNQLNQKESPK